MLTQTEADTLIAMRKTFLHPRTISLPRGADETHDLIGEDKRELFLLDLWRGTIRLSKFRYQTRGRKVIVLVRLDIDSAPHTNPDGTQIGRSHLHLYREGYEDRWAFALDSKEFTDPTNMGRSFEDFCHYCNIKMIPPFQGTLL